jgi:hypothetical protein
MTPRNRHERRAAAKKAQQEAAASGDKRLKGMEIRYGGRTLTVTAYINTDEPIEQIVERVKIAARGPKFDMVLVAGGEVETDAAQDLWDATFPAMVDSAKNEN